MKAILISGVKVFLVVMVSGFLILQIVGKKVKEKTSSLFGSDVKAKAEVATSDTKIIQDINENYMGELTSTMLSTTQSIVCGLTVRPESVVVQFGAFVQTQLNFSTDKLCSAKFENNSLSQIAPSQTPPAIDIPATAKTVEAQPEEINKMIVANQESDLSTPEASPTPVSATPEASPTPVSATPEASPTPVSATPEASPTPVSATPEASPTPVSATPEASPTPVSATPEASPTPVSATPEASPTPVSATPEASPTPVSATPEASPTPVSATPEASPSPAAVTPEVTPVVIEQPKSEALPAAPIATPEPRDDSVKIELPTPALDQSLQNESKSEAVDVKIIPIVKPEDMVGS